MSCQFIESTSVTELISTQLHDGSISGLYENGKLDYLQKTYTQSISRVGAKSTSSVICGKVRKCILRR